MPTLARVTLIAALICLLLAAGAIVQTLITEPVSGAPKSPTGPTKPDDSSSSGSTFSFWDEQLQMGAWP